MSYIPIVIVQMLRSVASNCCANRIHAAVPAPVMLASVESSVSMYSASPIIGIMSQLDAFFDAQYTNDHAYSSASSTIVITPSFSPELAATAP